MSAPAPVGDRAIVSPKGEAVIVLPSGDAVTVAPPGPASDDRSTFAKFVTMGSVAAPSKLVTSVGHFDEAADTVSV